MTDLIGQILGNYRVEELIGAGGMGQVFRSHHIHMDWLAAIKIMHPALANDPGFQERFRDEVRAARALQHPHVVEIYDFGEQDGRFYLVMELVPHGSLRTLLHARARGEAVWPLAQGLELVGQAADALAFAHARGIIHRDIKPDNMLLVRQATRADDPPDSAPYLLKISDFGLARLVAHEGHTTATATMGTPAYMSPEQSRGDPLDGRSDIYALGVVLYELVTGQLPFDVKSLNEAIYKHIYSAPTSPRQLEPRLPVALDALIMRCLAKSADDRPASAAVLASELRDLLDDPALNALDPTTSRALPVAPTPRPPTTDRARRSEIVPRVQVLDADGHPAQIIELTHAGLTIGKLAANAIVLDGADVGRTHLRVTWDGEQVGVTDLGTRGGTQLNDTALVAHTPQPWGWGDMLRVGSFALRLDRRAPRGAPTNGLITPINRRGVADPLHTGEYITQPKATSRITSQLQSGRVKLAIAPGHEALDLIPGQQAFVSLVLTNTSATPDQTIISVDGLPEGWAHVPAQAIPIAPSTQTAATIAVSVPRATTSRTGVYPITIRARSQENRLESSVARASWTVLPFSASEVEVQPKRAEHPRAATYTAIVRNLGNAPMQYTLDSSDDDHALDYQLGQTEIVVPSGEALHVPLTVGNAHRWVGATRRRTFSVSATPTQGDAAHDSASFAQPPRIPAWTWGLAGVLLLLLLVGWGISAITATATANANSPENSIVSSTPLPGASLLEVSDSSGRLRTATPDATKQAALTALAQGTLNALTPATATETGTPTNTPTAIPTATPARPTTVPTTAKLNITVVVPTAVPGATGVPGQNGASGASGANGASGSNGSSASGSTSIPTSTPTGPRLSIANQEQQEGNSGTTTFVFIVSLSEASDQTVTVRYTTVDGSAVSGSDYTATSDTLTFNPGDLVKFARINVFGDIIVETNKTFVVELSNPVHATIAQAAGIGTIENDDQTPSLAPEATPTNTPQPPTSTPTHTPTPTLTPTPNSGPVAAADTYTIQEGNTLTAAAGDGLLSNDSDPNNDPLTVIKVGDPAHGVLTLNADGTFTYVPVKDFNGTDTFSYKVNDGKLDSLAATVTITINPGNDPPTASEVSLSINEDQTVMLRIVEDLGVNDIKDAQFAPNYSLLPLSSLAFTNGNAPKHTASPPVLDTNAGTITYIPQDNFFGTDTFTYQLCDTGVGEPPTQCVTQKVNITIKPVNDAPVFDLQSLTPIPEDAGTKNISNFATNIGAGPNETGQTPFTFIVTLKATTGTLAFATLPTINASGLLNFRVENNTSGTATLDVVLKDNGGITDGGVDTSAVKTFTLTINPQNDAPVLPQKTYTLPSIQEDVLNADNKGFRIQDVLIGDITDADDPGAIRGIAITGMDINNIAGIWQYALNDNDFVDVGTVTNNNARVLLANSTTRLRFVPAPNANGISRFFFRAWDQTDNKNAGDRANTDANGNTTPYSDDTAIARLDVIAQPDAINITLPSGTLNYIAKDPATIIDGAATVTAPDVTTFKGGTLTVQITNNGSADDLLAIRPDTSGSNQITIINGNTIRLDGQRLGTYTGGSSANPLVITFDRDAATPPAVQALIQHITYQNNTAAMSILPRTVEFELETSTNDQGSQSKQIVVERTFLDHTGWTAVATKNNANASKAIFGPGRWSTDTDQVGGERFKLGMEASHTITKIILDTTGSPNDWPRGYQIYVSATDVDLNAPLTAMGWGTPVATNVNVAAGPITTIDLPPGTVGRYILIVQTGTGDKFWSIHQIKVFGT